MKAQTGKHLLSIPIFRGTSLQPWQRGSGLSTNLPFNPHFQGHFTATVLLRFWGDAPPAFQSPFSGALHCNREAGKTQMLKLYRFQSPFSGALHCNDVRCLKCGHRWVPFNPHFQGHFTATPGSWGGWPTAGTLSIPIFRGTSLQLEQKIADVRALVNFQSPFSGALHCNPRSG